MWDTFARIPGKVHDGGTLDVACEHYTRYPEDIALMRSLGLKHYRLSLAWPRIFPHGRGPANQKGLDFYHRLIDTLLAAGITPWVTMFHWDLPQALEDEGGWRVRGVTDAFRTYAETIVRAYGDRVKHWFSVNEVLCFTRLAYGVGLKAPGAQESEKVVNQTYHHALMCHGFGVQAVREHGGPGARVGMADNSFIPVPVAETELDIEMARRAFVERNIRVLDPIYRGGYSAAYFAAVGNDAPEFRDEDFAMIAQPTDFLGLNIYTGYFVRAGTGGEPEVLQLPPNYPRADSHWLNLNARAMYWGPRLAAEVYGAPEVCITENGAGYDDGDPVGGEVLDLHRLDYVRACLNELKHVIDDGVNVSSYFLWSLMDNFEWEDGYRRRFGIVHVDFATQTRTPKLSAHWYARTMAENRVM